MSRDRLFWEAAEADARETLFCRNSFTELPRIGRHTFPTERRISWYPRIYWWFRWWARKESNLQPT